MKYKKKRKTEGIVHAGTVPSVSSVLSIPSVLPVLSVTVVSGFWRMEKAVSGKLSLSVLFLPTLFLQALFFCRRCSLPALFFAGAFFASAVLCKSCSL